jgi:N-methylhydantoinase A/oxoprolinase/acetone carboxylase beta subunit
MAGVEQAGVDLADTALFCHGTTVATNALITRNLPKAAMVCTRGFRDVVEIGRGTRDDLWDAYKDNAEPYIRRRDRLEVTERVDHRGEVAAGLVEHAYVGEGAADVDGDHASRVHGDGPAPNGPARSRRVRPRVGEHPRPGHPYG